MNLLRNPALIAAALLWLPSVAEASGDAAHHGASGITFWAWPDQMGDPVGIGYMLINFLVLLVILNQLIFKPLRKKHQARSEKIKEELERATKAREDAEELLKKSQARFEAIEQESTEILDSARNRAEQTSRRLIEKAEQDAQAIREGAEQFAKRNAARVRAEIEAEVAQRALEKAESTIRANFGAQDQSRMIDAYIQEVGQLNLGGPAAGKGARA